MQWWHNLAPIRGTNWKSGFELYDALERYEHFREVQNFAEMRKIFEEHLDVQSLWEFPGMIDAIVNGLRRSTPRKDRDHIRL